MSQQVSLNQLLKKTEHYDKVCGIFDTAEADFGDGMAARGVKAKRHRQARDARRAGGKRRDGDLTPDHQHFISLSIVMFWVT